MARSRLGLAAAFIAALGLAAACGSNTNTPTAPTTPATPTSLAITGGLTLSAWDATSQLTAMAALSDGSKKDVTAQAAWESSAPSIVSVSSTGVLKALLPGTAQIKATYQGLNTGATATFSVPPSDLMGTWTGTLFESRGAVPITLRITSTSGGDFSGQSNGVSYAGAVQVLSVSGNAVRASITGQYNVNPLPCRTTATVDTTWVRDQMTGTYSGSDCGGLVSHGNVSLTRQR